jgi:hypothetical protein
MLAATALDGRTRRSMLSGDWGCVRQLFAGMPVWPGGNGLQCSGFLRLGLTLPCDSELQTKNVCVDLTGFVILVFRF